MTHARSISRLLIAMGTAIALTAGALAGVVALEGTALWWRGLTVALIVNVAAAVMSLAVVVPGILAGGSWAVYGYLAGSVLRVMVAMAGCIAAVWVFHAPPVPTLMLTMPLYFVLLLVEAIFVARQFRVGGHFA